MLDSTTRLRELRQKYGESTEQPRQSNFLTTPRLTTLKSNTSQTNVMALLGLTDVDILRPYLNNSVVKSGFAEQVLKAPIMDPNGYDDDAVSLSSSEGSLESYADSSVEREEEEAERKEREEEEEEEDFEEEEDSESEKEEEEEPPAAGSSRSTAGGAVKVATAAILGGPKSTKKEEEADKKDGEEDEVGAGAGAGAGTTPAVKRALKGAFGEMGISEEAIQAAKEYKGDIPVSKMPYRGKGSYLADDGIMVPESVPEAERKAFARAKFEEGVKRISEFKQKSKVQRLLSYASGLAGTLVAGVTSSKVVGGALSGAAAGGAMGGVVGGIAGAVVGGVAASISSRTRSKLLQMAKATINPSPVSLVRSV